MAVMTITGLLVLPGLVKYGSVESLFALGINYFLVNESSPVLMIIIAWLSGSAGLFGMLVATILRGSKGRMTLISGALSVAFILLTAFLKLSTVLHFVRS